MTRHNRAAAGFALTLACAVGVNVANARAPVRPAVIPAGEIADAPSGFVELCSRDTVLCFAGHKPAVRGGNDRAPIAQVGNFPQLISAAMRPVGLPNQASDGDLAPKQPKTLSDPRGVNPWLSPAFHIGVATPTSASIPGWFMNTAAIEVTRSRQPSRASYKSRLRVKEISDSRQRAESSLLRKVNGAVNTYVRQIADIYTAGVSERWDRPGVGREAAGDCEDLAIEKRMELVEAGFDVNKLAFAIVYKRNYGMHTVLIARTEAGDMVLDSLSPHVLRWDKTKYSWLRIQSMDDPTRWHRVGPSLHAISPMQVVTVPTTEALS